MKVTPKQILVIVIIAVVMITMIILGIWAYRKGKKQVTIAKLPLDNAVTGSNNPAGVSQAEIVAIADALYRDMDGWNLSGHKVEPYQKLNALSDTDFVNAYNTFNTLHQSEGDGTLKEWIESETFVFDDVVESIIARMGRLNLK